MNIKKLFSISAIFCALCATSLFASSAEKIDSKDFVNQVSAKGIAEIESAKVALEKSSSSSVKQFAQQIINDHSTVNTELANIANRKNLEVAERADLTSRAKRFVFQHRDGESFDTAYLKNQIASHEESIELYQRAAESDDQEIASFAKRTLPKLQHHLKMAQDLSTQDQSNTQNRNNLQNRPETQNRDIQNRDNQNKGTPNRPETPNR